MSEPRGRVGLIAGTFEIIHPGVVRLLKDAKKVCDYLIVAVQDDPSIERPKIKFKPVFTKEERAEVLMSLRYVDECRFYNTEDDLVLMLLELKPDIRILGSDYAQKTITGRSMAPIYYHLRDHGWSNTKVRMAIYKSMKGKVVQ